MYLDGKMTTMNEMYGDGSEHEACVKCGFCKTCGDCKCTKNYKLSKKMIHENKFLLKLLKKRGYTVLVDENGFYDIITGEKHE